MGWACLALAPYHICSLVLDDLTGRYQTFLTFPVRSSMLLIDIFRPDAIAANTKTQLENLDKAGWARSSVAFRSDRT